MKSYSNCFRINILMELIAQMLVRRLRRSTKISIGPTPRLWVHDGHDQSAVDVLHGREQVRKFLADRIGQMQAVGIKHKVHQVVTDGKSGAFRAEVVGPSGESKLFFGWVEISDGENHQL